MHSEPTHDELSAEINEESDTLIGMDPHSCICSGSTVVVDLMLDGLMNLSERVGEQETCGCL